MALRCTTVGLLLASRTLELLGFSPHMAPPTPCTSVRASGTRVVWPLGAPACKGSERVSTSGFCFRRVAVFLSLFSSRCPYACLLFCEPCSKLRALSHGMPEAVVPDRVLAVGTGSGRPILVGLVVRNGKQHHSVVDSYLGTSISATLLAHSLDVLAALS